MANKSENDSNNFLNHSIFLSIFVDLSNYSLGMNMKEMSAIFVFHNGLNFYKMFQILGERFSFQPVSMKQQYPFKFKMSRINRCSLLNTQCDV